MTRIIGRKPHKYHATPTAVDGVRFASKREAARYGELKLLEKARETPASHTATDRSGSNHPAAHAPRTARAI